MSVRDQSETDRQNAAFWDVLCGSQLAKRLGITDNSPESLKKFDDWYFEFYPYLETYIPFAELKGKKVLDVGLGYGSVAQRIAEAGAEYHGLDIAQGPVGMANLRFSRGDFNARAIQGNVLDAPFEDNFFDWVFAIGCLHHTGNLERALEEVHRMLKPGGQAMIMVYSATSYRQFEKSPLATLRRLWANPARGLPQTAGDESDRSAYDVGSEGEAAPQTEFVSKKELAYLCRRFSQCTIRSENIGEDGYFKNFSRRNALKFGRFVGLDLYCHLKK